MGQSRTGRAIGGALSGAGGLLSQLATRRMAEAQAQQLQDDRLDESRIERNIKLFGQGFNDTEIDAFNAGGTPGASLPRQVQRALDEATRGGTQIPTEGALDMAAQQFVPEFGQGGPTGGGPHIEDSGLVQQLMGMPAELEAQRVSQLPPKTGYVDELVRPRSTPTPADFPLVGDGPPSMLSNENQEPLLMKQLVNLLTGESIGPPRASERTALEQALRERAIKRGGAEGAALGGLDAGADPRTAAQIESAAFAGDVGRFSADVSPEGIAAARQERETTRQLRRQTFIDQRKAEIDLFGATDTQKAQGLTLLGQYQTASKNYFELQSQYSKMINLAAKVRDGDSGAAALAMISTFAKVNDPASAITAGEAASASNTGGLAAKWINMYNQITTGEVLPVGAVADMLETAGELSRAAIDEHLILNADFSEKADFIGIPADLIIRDINERDPADPENNANLALLDARSR